MMVPRCVVLCAGEFGPLDFEVLPDDFVICCDEGYRYSKLLGIKPALMIGDLDSLTGEAPDDVELMRYRVEKDDSDSMLACREGLRRGFKEFYLLFSLGGRLDHTLANIQTLRFLQERGAAGRLIGPRDEAFLLTPGSSLTLPGREGYALSLFAIDSKACGVHIDGVKYPLDNAVLTNSFPLGLSNRVEGGCAHISVQSGTLLIVL